MGQRRAYLACHSGGSWRQAGVLPGGWLISGPGMATSANSALAARRADLLARRPVAKASLCVQRVS
jgi:hypothetical protein